MNDEGVPPRVLAAERMRDFREVLARSSLGCDCGHLLSEHDASDWTFHGEPVDRRCRVHSCSCGKHVTRSWVDEDGARYGWSCDICGARSYPYDSRAGAEVFAQQHREAR